jgi:hypothetical protein
MTKMVTALRMMLISARLNQVRLMVALIVTAMVSLMQATSARTIPIMTDTTIRAIMTRMGMDLRMVQIPARLSRLPVQQMAAYLHPSHQPARRFHQLTRQYRQLIHQYLQPIHRYLQPIHRFHRRIPRLRPTPLKLKLPRQLSPPPQTRPKRPPLHRALQQHQPRLLQERW